MPEAVWQRLIACLAKTDPEMGVDSIAGLVARELTISTIEAEAVIDLLASLYNMRHREAETPTGIVEALILASEATGKGELKPKTSDWSMFRKYMTDALALDDTFGILARAREIVREHERNYCRSRVLTDIRPIFGAPPEKGPAAAAVHHVLALVYHEGVEIKEFHIALKGRDLQELQSVILRALSKDKGSREFLKRVGIKTLPSQGHHNG